MDKFNTNCFQVLTRSQDFEKYVKDIRLLAVFGVTAQEALFITNEDHVYGFGRNRFGGLGLGTDETDIKSPRFNQMLSGRHVKDFFWGFEHWTALTANGLCYAWGHNQFGQLGVGSKESTATPILINGLANETIVEISCGGFHSLALTSDGNMYAWGENQFGQLGDGTYQSRAVPTLIPMKERFVSISCGKKHSMALSVTGRVYLWGINGYGQLGWVPNKLKRVVNELDHYCANRPQLIAGFEDISFAKAVCGPNHSLLLSNDGHIYAFGENTVGQIGNGSADHQFLPVKIKDDLKFDDIITTKDNDISIAISVDNEYYIWGLIGNRRNCIPKEVTDSSEVSVFEIYANSAKNRITYKTLKINETIDGLSTIDGSVRSSNNQLDDNEVYRSANSFSKDSAFDDSKQEKFIDDIVNLDVFLNNPSIIDEYLRYNIKLFRVFGVSASKVIFVTIDDKVYSFGLNRDGSLGLKSNEEVVRKPTLNDTLSGQQLVDIACGFEHCIGLTARGKCFGWGLNKYGELGIGNCEKSSTPVLIEDLADLKVVQICCGSYHSMALTSDGDLFAWGYNTFAQLGDRSFNSRDRPTQVMIQEKVSTVSSGCHHSLALTQSGVVYLWGVNSKGQLGRDPIRNNKNRDKPMSNRPTELVLDKAVEKAVCGPNHVLLMTTEGHVYAFGDNTRGQVGNGTFADQFTPLLLNKSPKSPKIKDIISYYDNDLSIAVSVDNKVYYWGWAQNAITSKPKLVDNSFGNSLFNIYAKLAKNKVTFKTVDINEDFDRYVIEMKSSLVLDESSLATETGDERHMNGDNRSCDETNEDTDSQKSIRQTISVNLDPISSECLQQMSTTLMASRLRNSFDKQYDSDLTFKSDDKVFYCHKTILKLRNKRFWNHLSREMNGANRDVYVNSGHSSGALYAFVQYLYGIEPQIDVRFVADLRDLAKSFDEPELEDMCEQLIGSDLIDESTVCGLYEKAVTEGSADLEKSCVEFAADNWKNVCKSDAFQTMDDKLSKRLMLSVFNM